MPRSRYASLYERIVANLHEPENEQACWVWALQCGVGGYGRINVYDPTTRKPVKLMVHRVLWEQFNGPVPDGHELDHLCHNPPCCNPDHLRVVLPKENCANRRPLKTRQRFYLAAHPA